MIWDRIVYIPFCIPPLEVDPSVSFFFSINLSRSLSSSLGVGLKGSVSLKCALRLKPVVSQGEVELL